MNNVFFPVLTATVPCPFLKYVPAFVIPNLASAGHSILNQLLFLSNNLSVSSLKSRIPLSQSLEQAPWGYLNSIFTL